jgi:hypothetical protein
VPSETGLGTLLVDERGEGKLDVTLKDANLKTEGRGSLLGKALVVYRMLPPAKPGERAERAWSAETSRRASADQYGTSESHQRWRRRDER